MHAQLTHGEAMFAMKLTTVTTQHASLVTCISNGLHVATVILLHNHQGQSGRPVLEGNNPTVHPKKFGSSLPNW